jgi:cytosine/adenosine deaminase-related metal-dependent hydrolase
VLRLSGWIYADGAFREGSVYIDRGEIHDVSHRRLREPDAKGLILPGFTNAHTHAGDAVVREELTGTIEELVAPPHGLKHRVLSAAKDEDVIAAMRGYLESMMRAGATGFWDFRETGVRGIRQLYAAALGLPLRPMVFGRPSALSYDAREVRAILNACDGIGLSSLLDWNTGEAAKIAKAARDAGRAFALHASERIREDIDHVLDHRPSLLVHMTEATDADLQRTAEAGVPVVACPRSNAFFGKVVDLPRMARAGVRLLLGTDNAMINAPSMMREMDFAWKIAKLHGGIEPRVLLDAALRGAKGLGAPVDVSLAAGDPADVVVLDVPDGRPTFGGVFRSLETDIAFMSAGGRTWRRKGSGLVERASRRARSTPARRHRVRSSARAGRRQSTT